MSCYCVTSSRRAFVSRNLPFKVKMVKQQVPSGILFYVDAQVEPKKPVFNSLYTEILSSVVAVD